MNKVKVWRHYDGAVLFEDNMEISTKNIDWLLKMVSQQFDTEQVTYYLDIYDNALPMKAISFIPCWFFYSGGASNIVRTFNGRVRDEYQSMARLTMQGQE